MLGLNHNNLQLKSSKVDDLLINACLTSAMDVS